ncbi:hypothetical protein Q8A73_014692 [Channa argus]|nr:hypothetical protein Q8A73_014692 [Channa argus]
MSMAVSSTSLREKGNVLLSRATADREKEPQGGIKCHLRVGHLQTRGHQPICRYKQLKIRKPPPALEEIEEVCSEKKFGETAKHKEGFCLPHAIRSDPFLVAHFPIDGARHNGLIKDEGAGNCPSSRSPHLCISYRCSCFLLTLTRMLVVGNRARSSRSSQSKWSVFQR